MEGEGYGCARIGGLQDRDCSGRIGGYGGGLLRIMFKGCCRWMT